MSYVLGDMIIGGLDELGWVVIIGIRIDNETYETINVISEAGYTSRVTMKSYWISIEEHISNRVVKYKASSSPHVH